MHDLDRVTAISASVSHSLALREDGSVVAWGSLAPWRSSATGRASTGAPVAVRDLDAGVTAISAAGHKSVALREDGSVVGWGLSVVPGKHGIDNLPDRPMPIPGLGAGVVAIAAGGYLAGAG